MLRQLVFALSYLNWATLLLALGVGLFYRRHLTPSLRLSWLALFAYFILFSLSLSKALGWVLINTELIKYLIAGIFGAFFVLAYWLLLPAGWRRPLVAGLGILGALGLLVEAVVQGRALQDSTWSVPLQTVINTLVPLLYWPVLLRQTRTSLLNVPIFWFTAGLLVSSILGTFYDAFYPMMLAASLELLMGWLCFQLGVTILCNGLYAMGFYKARTL